MKISTTSSNITNKEQLFVAFIASTKMLFVALSCVVLFFALFVKAIISFGMVVLVAFNMAIEWMIGLVCSTDEMRAFFLAANGR